MAGRKGRRGGSRGRRGGRNAAQNSVEGYPYPLRFPSEHPTRVRTQVGGNQSRVLRGPIRCLTSPSSISTSAPLNITNKIPDVQLINDEEFHCNPAAESSSPTSAAILKDKNDLDAFLASRYIDPQPSSNHADDDLGKSTTNYAASTHSFNVTEFAQKLREDDPEEEVESAVEPGFDYVNGHQVKIENAPLISAIFERYGDITIGSRIKSPEFLSCTLEYLCDICNKLKETKFADVTVIELEKKLTVLEDLEGQNLNVGWLRERIKNIIKARVDSENYLAIKEENNERERYICALQEKLDEMKKVALEIRSRVTYHNTHSLLDGLF